MSRLAILALPVLAVMLSGCLVRTAASVVTAPVKVASKAIDLTTTSQSESDQKRGRELRRREERLGQLEREYAKQTQRCERGDSESCARRDAAYAEIQAILPTVPAEPR
jgi:hypothetical protein